MIGRKHSDKAGKIIHLAVYRDWNEIDRLMRNFNVSRSVVDALPETRNARAFAESHRGKVYLNYYNARQEGHYAWNEKEPIVSCNRTESLDASHREVSEQAIVLPKECATGDVRGDTRNYLSSLVGKCLSILANLKTSSESRRKWPRKRLDGEDSIGKRCFPATVGSPRIDLQDRW